MCNLSWTPHSNLEKDNSLKTTPVLAQRWAVWSILRTRLPSKEHLRYTDGSRQGLVSLRQAVTVLLTSTCTST